MGGKSRKSGSVSKALINRIVGNSKKGKCGGKNKKQKTPGLLDNDKTN